MNVYQNWIVVSTVAMAEMREKYAAAAAAADDDIQSVSMS
jgi:hypothetical protein